MQRICRSYLVIMALIIGVDLLIALTTKYGSRSGIGCNFFDALLIGIECREFPAAAAVGWILNLPLLLLYAPVFATSVAWFIPVAFLLWFPPVFLVASAIWTHVRPRT